jgi:hypothetical protein
MGTTCNDARLAVRRGLGKVAADVVVNDMELRFRNRCGIYAALGYIAILQYDRATEDVREP